MNLRNDKQHYQEGLFIFDIPTFNERVVREVLLNAVSHRNYQLGGSVFVRQYRDRLVVESPGGLPHGVTLDNILDKQNPRNRLIASLLALCGLVERSGQGMNIIYELSVQEAKALPDFAGTDDYQVKITLNGLIIDKRMLAVLKQIGEERFHMMATDDFLIVHTLFHEQKLPMKYRGRIKQLVNIGVVEQVARNKFVLARSLYAAIGKAGVRTRIVGLDKPYNKELLFQHIQQSGTEGTPMGDLLQVLPGHSRAQLRTLLEELRDENRVCVSGVTSSARWYPVENGAI